MIKHDDSSPSVQFDGGRTYTEPSVIMTGRPENGSEVSFMSTLVLLHVFPGLLTRHAST